MHYDPPTSLKWEAYTQYNMSWKNLYMNIYIYIYTYIYIYIYICSITYNSQRWKQINCPSTDEQSIHKMQYIVEFNLATKRNKIQLTPKQCGGYRCRPTSAVKNPLITLQLALHIRSSTFSDSVSQGLCSSVVFIEKHSRTMGPGTSNPCWTVFWF